MIRYIFRDDGPVTIVNLKQADPQRIGEELAQLDIEDAGELHADRTWKYAQANPGSALHRHFTWDPTRACEKLWLIEAREIIRSIRTIDDDKPEQPPQRAYLNVNLGGNAYRRLSLIESSISLQGKLLEAADRDLAAWQRRYGEIADCCALVTEARERLREQQEQEQRARARQQRGRRPPSGEARPIA